MKRRDLLVLLPAGVLGLTTVSAQDRAKIARIGFLGPGPATSFAPRVEALRAGLRELGYVEGRNLELEFRWA